QVNALAYTVGRDIVFGGGQYAPNTSSGRRLLAHELVHVAQQAGHRNRGAPHPPALQRFGDPSQAPATMTCPIESKLPKNIVTNMLFENNSSNLLPTAITHDIPDFIGRWTKAGANRPVQVDGFASVTGPQALNWQLSCDRAKAVVAELEHPSHPSGGGDG